MDKLEQYLDQVCRRVGGPRSLRHHLRQELREHLHDAAAEHRAAGLSEEEALDGALADFGGPEEVRTELEATHGHRWFPVILDKTMQWKERTMRARWVWTTWAYLAIVAVLILEVLCISFASVYLVPKLKELRRDGWLGDADSYPVIEWLYSFLDRMNWALEHLLWLLLGVVVLWGFFEWRVRSENKTLMRLSALGSGGVALMTVVFLMMAALVLPFMVGLPGTKIARPWAIEAVLSVDKSVTSLEQSLAKKDWEAAREHAGQIARGLGRLEAGPSLHALTNWNERPSLHELRDQLQVARGSFTEVEQAIDQKDADQVELALERFQKAYSLLRDAAQRSTR
jgi:hypothetical protein